MAKHFTSRSTPAMIAVMSRTGERIGRVDVAIAVLLTALGVVQTVGDVQDDTMRASWLVIPLFLAVTIPVLWRRASPLAALGAVFVAIAVHVAAFGDGIIRCGATFPVVGVLVFAAAARYERRRSLYALAAGAATITLMGAFDQAGADVVTLLVPLTLLSWGLGRIAASRSKMAVELRRRTDDLRVARDERAQLEVMTDRAQLSSELDTLLHRRIGELAQLAESGAEHAADPAAATVALAQIEGTSRRTLEEMREIVGVLRDDAPLTPQPTLASLDALLLQAKGGDARLRIEGNPRALPAGVELAAYRVVEHLLAAVGEASGVEVRLGFGDDALEIGVTGPVNRRTDVSAALDRARERVQVQRGTLEARTRGGRAEAIAHLPVTVEA